MRFKTKIVLADGRLLFRKSLKVLLNDNPSLQVVAEAGDGKELMDMLKKTEADLVILDSDLPMVDCKSILQIISCNFPQIKIIVLSMNYSDNLLPEYVNNGAACYLSKNCDVETLYRAIKHVVVEGYFIDNNMYKTMLINFTKEKAPARKADTEFNEKEISILKEICDGKTNKEIAVIMNISVSTVDFYRSKIYTKSKCNHITSLLKFALRNGFVSL